VNRGKELESHIDELHEQVADRDAEVERLRGENGRLREDFRKTRHIVAEKECERLQLVIAGLEKKQKALVEEIGVLNFQSGQIVAERDQLRARVAELEAENGRLSLEALATLSKYTATAVEGYRAAPHLLAWDIDRLGQGRNCLRANLLNLVAACDRGGLIDAALSDARAALKGDG
jgi:chromosome segregation ATPase